MARIDRAEHARILRLVDGEGRKVAEVAAEYGCTPGNIYALLNRLRRGAGDAASTPSDPPAPEPRPEADPPATRGGEYTKWPITRSEESSQRSKMASSRSSSLEVVYGVPLGGPYFSKFLISSLPLSLVCFKDAVEG